MKPIDDFITEKYMRIIPRAKIEKTWNEFKDKLGDNFEQALYDSMDNQQINVVLWNIDKKYKLNIIK